MAVVVQSMVEARAAGVMFTRSPTTGDRSVVTIEGAWGLGSAVGGVVYGAGPGVAQRALPTSTPSPKITPKMMPRIVYTTISATIPSTIVITVLPVSMSSAWRIAMKLVTSTQMPAIALITGPSPGIMPRR